MLAGLLALGSLAFPALGPRVARAQPVRVERDSGAASCPDSEQLGARLARLRPSQPPESATRYSVHFTSQGAELTASIAVQGETGADPRVRVLNARGPSCEVLAQAASVALALMLDADTQAPAPEKAETPVVQRVPEAPVVVTRAEPVMRATLTAGGGALLGVTQPIIPVFLGEVGLEQHRYRADIGALGAPVQRFGFGPGSLREWLLAGSLRGCVLPYRGAAFSIGSCVGAYVGVLDVRARGYTRNAQRKQLWAALPIELFVAYTRLPLALELSAAALIPLRRPDFSLDGLGPAYESWPVALGLFLRLSGGVAGTTKKK